MREAAGAWDARRVTEADALGRPPLPADLAERYGPDDVRSGDLRVPRGAGPHPVVVLLHGGCWRAVADRRYMEPLAVALTGAGWATWNLEYRTVDHAGGGYPGTFRDVAAGVDHLARLAADHELDLRRVVTLGHSAGGHLALWAAARERGPQAARRRSARRGGAHPVRVGGVAAMAGIADLEAFDAEPSRGCGDAVRALLGGVPGEVPRRLARTSPARLLPLGVPQLLVVGAADDVVPPDHVRGYAVAARGAGDPVEVVVVEGAAHFEVVAPWWQGWRTVEEPLLRFLAQV